MEANAARRKSPQRTSRQIWVEEFTTEAAERFRAQVEEAAHTPDTPIIFYINSDGGRVDALTKMIDVIEYRSNPFISVVSGSAKSCGAILASWADQRFITRNSRIMIHEVSAGTIGDTHDMSNTAAEVQRLNEFYIGKLAENCGLGGFKELRKIIKSHDGRDLWLSAEDSVKFGIVDAIGMPRISTSVSYKLLLTDPIPSEERSERVGKLLGLTRVETSKKKSKKKKKQVVKKKKATKKKATKKKGAKK